MKTLFYDEHVALSGKMVDFAGYDLPVHYSSHLEEHHAVRKTAGLFDVSHMGEFHVTGPDSAAFVQHLITNDLNNIQPGGVLYTPMCQADGGIVDDLLVYRLADNEFMLVVNASNRAKDLAWCRKVAEGKDTKIEDISDQYSLLALQGPKAELILSKLTDVDLSELAPFHFLQTEVTGRPCILSRTGYTGEDGFELYLKGEKAKGLFAEIIAAGKEDGLVPAGLAARDTLRFECKLMLYGNDIDATTSPIEATIGWTVKLEKGSFMGCEVIRDHKDNKPPRRLVGIRMTEKGIPRHGHKIFSTDGEELGFITSGTKSPSLGDFLALGYVKQGFTKIGTELLIEIRNNKKTGKIIKTPFYKKQTS